MPDYVDANTGARLDRDAEYTSPPYTPQREDQGEATMSDNQLREQLKTLYNESRKMARLRTGSPIDHMVEGALQLLTEARKGYEPKPKFTASNLHQFRMSHTGTANAQVNDLKDLAVALMYDLNQLAIQLHKLQRESK